MSRRLGRRGREAGASGALVEAEAPPASAPGGRREGEPSLPPPPRRGIPEHIEVHAADVACIGPIVVLSLYALPFIGAPLTPLLLGPHPVLLALLRGSVPAMVACGAGARVGHLPLWQALLAPLPILIASDPFLYWAGRRYGRAILDYYAGQGERWRRRIARAELYFARYGVVAIGLSALPPVSGVALFLFLAAGETRMPIWRFAIADLISNLVWIGLIVSLGWFLGQRGVDVADAISHYGTRVAIAGLVVAVGWTIWQSVGRRRRAG